MMHLHTEHFPSARIRNRVRWQGDDFFAWLHKLHSAILQLLTADLFSYGVLVLLLSAGKVMVVKFRDRHHVFRTTSLSIACTTLHT